MIYENPKIADGNIPDFMMDIRKAIAEQESKMSAANNTPNSNERIQVTVRVGSSWGGNPLLITLRWAMFRRVSNFANPPHIATGAKYRPRARLIPALPLKTLRMRGPKDDGSRKR